MSTVIQMPGEPIAQHPLRARMAGDPAKADPVTKLLASRLHPDDVTRCMQIAFRLRDLALQYRATNQKDYLIEANPAIVGIDIAIVAALLAGSAAAQATAAAELQHGISLAGAAVGQTAAAAELQHGVSLGGAAQGQATASGDITIGNGIPVVPDAGDRQKIFIGGGGGARGSRDHRLQQERERIRRQNDVIMSAVMSSVLRRPIAFCADPARASPFRAV